MQMGAGDQVSRTDTRFPTGYTHTHTEAVAARLRVRERGSSPKKPHPRRWILPRFSPAKALCATQGHPSTWGSDGATRAAGSPRCPHGRQPPFAGSAVSCSQSRRAEGRQAGQDGGGLAPCVPTPVFPPPCHPRQPTENQAQLATRGLHKAARPRPTPRMAPAITASATSS